MDRLTALSIPTHLLQTAYLVGKLPFRACQTEPRVSYALYIPPKQYCSIHTHLRKLQKPGAAAAQAADQTAGIEAPPKPLQLIVNIHGYRRDASRCRDSLISFADTHGVAILAPLFPAGLDGFADLDNYKNLRNKTLNADIALLDILAEISRFWPGIKTDKVTMVGFSGGAQFAHRFCYVHPERVGEVLLASPGAITGLDGDKEWPEGIKNAKEVFGREVDVGRVAGIGRISWMIGGEDTLTKEVAELRAWVAKNLKGKEGKSGVGRNADGFAEGRMEAVRLLHREWNEKGIECDLKVVDGIGHDYLGMLPSMLEWLAEYKAMEAIDT